MDNKLLQYLASLKYKPNRHLVGVQFIFDKNEYEQNDVPEADHQLFFCMMIKIATSGNSLKVTKKHFYCTAAAQILGFSPINKDILSGETPYKRNMYCSLDISKSISENTPYLKHEIYGMIIQPLELFKTEPHIVISISNPYTAMRIIQGYSYKFGFAQNIKFSGMGGFCTELVARSYYNNDINVSLLCSNSRFSTAWNDDEMGISMPYPMFLDVMDGVLETLNLFEPDNKKAEIIARAENLNVDIDVQMGNNYFDSCSGIAKIGVVGYFPKSPRK